jgi:hypothetical protein
LAFVDTEKACDSIKGHDNWKAFHKVNVSKGLIRRTKNIQEEMRKQYGH